MRFSITAYLLGDHLVRLSGFLRSVGLDVNWGSR